MGALFKPNFPRFYRKRSEDRDVSARATHLKAAMENVFMTTTERKRMSTKTTFKRIALVAAAALGLGVLSVAPSTAAINSTDETLTLSASSTSVAIGETASVTITSSFIGTLTAGTGFVDSRTILVTGSGAGGTPVLIASNSDSANVRTGAGQYFSSVSTVLPTTIGAALGDSYSATTGATYTKGVFTLNIPSVVNTGTFTYTVVSQDTAKTAIFKTATFTVTVTSGNTTPVAANSDAQITDTSRSAYVARLGDSALVVDAGTVGGSAAKVAEIYFVQKNSDSATTTTGGLPVGDSVIATVVSGPGTLAIGSASCTAGQYTVTAGGTDTYFTVCSEPGKSGLTTISLKTNNMNPWLTKTLTFYSTTIDSLALATVSTGNIAGAAATYASQVTKTGELKVTAKDAGGSVIGTGANLWIYSSDTKVVTNYGAATCTSPDAGAVSYYACNLVIADSGTVTLTVGDSNTIARSVKTATLSVTIAGNAFTPTVAFDKTSYAPGEKAILTLTAKDSAGRNVANGAGATGYTSVAFQGLATPTFGAASLASDTAGGSLTNNKLDDFLNASSATYYGGVDTVVVYMPSTAGTYTVIGKVGPATLQTTLLTFTVADATKDAADAATDAALEATDAAYAAQDAAQLAAEAADAATAAAEAATAAVEDLATQVAALFADLQKQITTLANVVAKIAKKVKA